MDLVIRLKSSSGLTAAPLLNDGIDGINPDRRSLALVIATKKAKQITKDLQTISNKVDLAYPVAKKNSRPAAESYWSPVL